MAAELLGFGEEMKVIKLHEICMEVWKTGEWPEEWTQSTFIPLCGRPWGRGPMRT